MHFSFLPSPSTFHLPLSSFHFPLILLLTLQSYNIFHRELCLLMPFSAFWCLCIWKHRKFSVNLHCKIIYQSTFKHYVQPKSILNPCLCNRPIRVSSPLFPQSRAEVCLAEVTPLALLQPAPASAHGHPPPHLLAAGSTADLRGVRRALKIGRLLFLNNTLLSYWK